MLEGSVKDQTAHVSNRFRFLILQNSNISRLAAPPLLWITNLISNGLCSNPFLDGAEHGGGTRGTS